MLCVQLLSQVWIYKDRMLMHRRTRKCLSITVNKLKLIMEVCNSSFERQEWILQMDDTKKNRR